MNFKETCFLLLIGGVTSQSVYLGITYLGGRDLFNTIPRDINIESGAIQPSELEINLNENSESGFNEIVLNYKGNNQILKLGKEGLPYLEPENLIK